MIEISTLVKNQFPDYLKAEGPNLIAFVEAYYEWVEQSELIQSQDLLDLRDIDSTVDEFIDHFKVKYLQGLPKLTRGDLRQFIKHSKDLYEAKGTEKSIQLLLRLLYDVDSTVYSPGNDTLRASAGTWYKPTYIEVTAEDNNKTFVDKQIIGASSGAKAIVESVVRRITNGVYYDVLYLSSVLGNFQTNERVTADGSLQFAPTIVGSLNDVQILNGGQNNKVGDVFDIFSKNGKQGRGRVAAVENGTGRVDFQLVDGGAGYTMYADTIVSDTMFTVGNYISGPGFRKFETVTQQLNSLNLVSGNGSYVIGDTVNGYTSGTWILQGTGRVVAYGGNTSVGTLVVEVASGDFRAADVVRKAGNTVGGLIDASSNVTASANVVSANATHLGIFNEVNNFYVPPFGGTFKGKLSNTRALIANTGTGFGADFQIGSIENEETVFINTDFWHDNNTANVPYLAVGVNGSGSGVGFVDKVVVGRRAAISNTAHAFAVDDDCWQQYANGTSYATGILGVANTTSVVIYTNTGTFNTSFPLLTKRSSSPVTALTTISGTGYSNGSIITFTGGGASIGSVTIQAAGTGYANGQHIVISGTTIAEEALITVITNANGAITTANIIEGGKYRKMPTLSVANTAGTGAILVPVMTNPTPAVGTITTDGSGGLASISLNNQGTGYFFEPTPSIAGGTGALFKPMMDYGYGLPKNPQGDLGSIINDCLFSDTIVAGAISSLTRIAPGQQYNIDPFVAVSEPYVAGLDRRDFILSLSDINGAFITGEFVEQDIIAPTFELKIGAITGNTAYTQNEVVRQGTNTGILYYRDATTLRVRDLVGSFSVGTPVVGTFSKASANVTTVSSITQLSTAKGEVRSANSSSLTVRRTSINTSFKTNVAIKGRKSSANAMIVAYNYDYDYEAMGNNAIVTANVKTANGIATDIEIIDSGYGYSQDEDVELVNPDNIFVINGRSTLTKQGTGEGFWTSTKGFLDNDQYIHDGKYYQAYSYEVQTELSLDRYADILHRIVHVAGTQLFGKVVINPSIDFEFDVDSTVQQA